ncbi:hypothetical protein SAMN04488128_1021215 [Chitinophaga eiseniae]|uniref:Alpha-L-rhamnosidase six-hairpin glycosidase domain-containing protein n=1 Tax=Chitinophaga eiseniae TaxID=634771 RepID=A0A1T4RJF1_9BACT|nr:hypothetical protein [Chitinophaga eiseniae]SKA16059.1 hypothetical protein SAMN04488128_1021215 [Chitinophaga eiseniae]
MKTILIKGALAAACLCAYDGYAQTPDRWQITPGGSIIWNINGHIPHADHIEMAGKKVALWLQYGVDSSGASAITRTIVFPTYRLVPNKTETAMMYTISDNMLPRFFINNKLWKPDVYNGGPVKALPEKVRSIQHKGITTVTSVLGNDHRIELKRTFFPSDNQPLVLEQFVFINHGTQPVPIEMEAMQLERMPAESRSANGPLYFTVETAGAGRQQVAAGDSVRFVVGYSARRGTEPRPQINADAEMAGRRQRIAGILSLLQLETPDTLLNTAFAFAKIRATESIYLTKGGYLHGPGGLRYYAAIWANDQAEYVNPFFGFLGDSIALNSAMNSYRWFAKYMNPDYKPIPSSIVAEGDGTWHGAGDRGDMAMIAYGASRYALAAGNADSARVLWPLIEWSLEYLRRQVNENGVVHSDSDELEGRFPAGNANLNTSALYYDALRSAVLLAKQLKVPARDYAQRAAELRKNIDRFFGATVEGFDTYRYYGENKVLRAWIATPLTTGLFERKAGTIAALFSPKLWTEDGLASQSGDRTFWDRSTLYALRGVFAAGETARAMDKLEYYSRRRLLGEHVPYPVEAYPEGNQRHLSAESGLYCRIFTEGMFGMRPTGFNSFDCTPRLPEGWDHMALRNIHAFGRKFDVEVKRKDKGRLLVMANGKEYTIKEGTTLPIVLK